MNTRVGRVVAVCVNDKSELRKHPRGLVRVDQYGFEGDRHAGPIRKNHKTGIEKFNDRQITIVAKEVVESIAKELQVEIPVGGLGENMLVEGLGDLSDLTGGELLQFEGGVVLEVTGQNDPCKNINVYHKLVAKKIYGRRGIYAIVRKEGIIQSGEAVTVES
jgi:MOSC domain-containing protein YiiM